MTDKDFDYGLPPKGVFGEEPDELGLTWFSYLHMNGIVITKRYLCWLDYKEAGDSNFTVYVTRLFKADGSTAASKEGARLIQSHFLKVHRW